MKLGKNTLWFVLMLLSGAALFYLVGFVLSPFNSMTRFPEAILLIYIGVLSLMYMDKIHHSNINTEKAINENNTAYGLIMLSYSIIIAAVLSAV